MGTVRSLKSVLHSNLIKYIKTLHGSQESNLNIKEYEISNCYKIRGIKDQQLKLKMKFD